MYINVICQNRRFAGRHRCRRRFLVQVNLEQNLSGSMAEANNLALNFCRLLLIVHYLILDSWNIHCCASCPFYSFCLSSQYFDHDDEAAGRSDYTCRWSIGGLLRHRSKLRVKSLLSR
jgi:hypothetical protein